MIGNTSMSIHSGGRTDVAKMNEISDALNGVGGIGFTQYGNDNEDMEFADVDGVTSTVNSSSADLVLPAGTNTIKFARLYWGGRIDNAVIAAVPDTLRKIKIRKGANSYSSILAPENAVDLFAVTETETIYQCYSDITNYLEGSGTGTYTIADLPSTPGNIQGGGHYGGWSIVIAYENISEPLNTIRVYHGYYQIYDGGTASDLTVTLNNLNVPNTPLSNTDAKMSVMGWEGDGNLGESIFNPQGDFLKINTIPVANPVNVGTNFWNGSISKNGEYVTNKNPDYSNQMGIDIDEVFVGTGFDILPNATSIDITFGTEADQYFPSSFAFQIRVKDPLVTIHKTVADFNNNGIVESNEQLTYTLTGTNNGPGKANNVFIVDTIPTNLTYVANSMEVVQGPGMTPGAQTDAQDAADNSFQSTNAGKTYLKFFAGTGSTNSAGGIFEVGEVYTVKFKVQAATIPGSISNTATSYYAYSLGGELFTDVSTAVISPAGGPLPVTLLSFTASFSSDKSQGLLHWITENETANKSFIVERSEDGVHFTSLGKINGNGTTRIQHSYDYNDDLNGLGAKVLYYRLRITSIDGEVSYSQIVLLKLDTATLSMNGMRVYPNPYTENVKVYLTSNDRVTTTFSMISADGRRVSSQNVQVEKGGNIVVLQSVGSLPNGNYILEVSTGTERYVMKLVKN